MLVLGVTIDLSVELRKPYDPGHNFSDDKKFKFLVGMSERFKTDLEDSLH